ncbi:unnamed protein product [Candidula unifasciata]|uniref:JmjC domain-containing protein n=1 Tax=Candidula unifasciata TaxID=100452 RepID=A0A8S3ZSF1_9EUPU|nr:unnamed protein product [Candidula unifasciata]
MSSRRPPQDVIKRKIRNGVTTSNLSSQATKSPKRLNRPHQKQPRSAGLLSLSHLLSGNIYSYRTPTKIIVFLTITTVLLVFLYQTVLPFASRHFASLHWSFSNTSLEEIDFKSSGWRLPDAEVLQKYGSDICNIERVSFNNLPEARFETEFRFKKPVLVTFPNGAADWTEPGLWSRSELSKAYSKWTIHSGQSLEIVRTGGNARHASSFQEFLTNLMADKKTGTLEPMHYVFDRSFYGRSNLPKTLHLPKYFEVSSSEDDSVFFLGSSMTGVVFHKHSDTWNGVVYGSKRWFLYPNTKTPPGGVHHGFSVLEWVDHVYPNLTDVDKPIECVQQPGEILYLPEGTYHATLNLGDTIAVAMQKKNAVTKAELLSYEESSEAVMKIGRVLYDLGKYSQSLPWHIRAIKMDPFFVVAYIHLAKTFSALRDYKKAETTFKKAIQLSPNLWDTYKEYGEFLLKQGRHQDALPVYKKGTELMPDMVPFWFYYKLCQLQTGDLEGAEKSEKMIADLKARTQIERN